MARRSPVTITLCPPAWAYDLDVQVTARPRDLTLLLGSSRAPVAPEEWESDDDSDHDPAGCW